MIFSLPPALIKTTEKVLHNSKAVSYSWGNENALHQWIATMDKKQIERVLGLNSSTKYPLIWLVDGWKAKENGPGADFTNVNFYIAINSKAELLNEQRESNFGILYQVGNDFIDELKKVTSIKEGSIGFYERRNFCTTSAETGETKTSDIWDCLIITVDFFLMQISDSCFK